MRQYEEDYTAWAEKTAQLLAKRDFGTIDFEALIEEVEGLSRSDRKTIRSHLHQILFHLLKFYYANENDIARAGNGWADTIRNARLEIELAVEDSPSLHSYPIEVFVKEYQRARRKITEERKVELAMTPVECPWTIDQVMTDGFYGEEPTS